MEGPFNSTSSQTALEKSGVGSSSLRFMTCDQLREAFANCIDDINKRILIIDVRDHDLFKASALCLDSRNVTIKRKMRVMNINPDSMKTCTIKSIMSILDESDLKVFKNRRDATEVVVIDRNTDDIKLLSEPRSKVMRLVNALTKFDNHIDDKIVVPIHILEGGFRAWSTQYPHFTTNPSFDPDAQVHKMTQMAPSAPVLSPIQPASQFQQPPPMKSIDSINDTKPTLLTSTLDQKQPRSTKECVRPQPIQTHFTDIAQQPASPKLPVTPNIPIRKPVPIPPKGVLPITPKPSFAKNAPGTAVPISPASSLRSVLPRSHSSPNVAQADGDELNETADRFNVIGINSKDISERCLNTNNNIYDNQVNSNYGNNHLSPVSVCLSGKPRFDRTLKPTFNNESISAIRAQLDFGRSPEASGKAITGLQNLGNTCFMNSVIQCLAYARDLIYYFCSDVYYNHINFNSQYGTKGELAVEFGALVERLTSHRHRYIEPRSFRNAVVKHIGFAGNEQQDSHEFMMMLFDKLHHDLNLHAKDKFKQNGIVSQNGTNDDDNINIPRATLGYQFWKKHLDMNKSIVSDLFEGIFMSTLTCTFCKGQSNTFEVFNCLSLPIPSDVRCHVRDCLNHFSNPERIEAAWECPRCKQKREADKKIVICKLPKILIIHLKRFSLDGRWRQKLQTTVDFPLIDLVVDCTAVLPQSAYGPSPVRSSYNLYAVVNHYGHLDGGHYTAYCKLENMRWYTFDDSNVSEMKDADVCGQAAYILFYRSNQ